MAVCMAVAGGMAAGALACDPLSFATKVCAYLVLSTVVGILVGRRLRGRA
jgi:hypothetical protein